MSTRTMMTLREKVAHLHRRLGFGATPAELDLGVKEGLDKTIERLIDYEKVPDAFPYVYENFIWREKEEPDLGAWRVKAYWIARMMTTSRPLKEKLAVFWHSHFAVGDEKVEDGPMMLEYLETLREGANGNFLDLLRGVAQSPAMMRYLDMTRSIRGTPNENFAREIMELFTLGIDGGYTETDVKEVARALTGYGMLHMFYEMPGNTEEKIRARIKTGAPFAAFTYIPAAHDPGPKTILGKTAPWDAEGVFAMLAAHPATHRRLSHKLWTFFGMENPPEKAVERTAKALAKGDIKAGLRSLVRAPEFWSEACVRNLVRSPMDLVIGVARQQGVGAGLVALHDPKSDLFSRAPQRCLDEPGYANYRMERMGLNLLYPPDVAGWNWDRRWLSPAAMAERYAWQGQWHWEADKLAPGARGPLEFVRSRGAKTKIEIARALAELHDLSLSDAQIELAAKSITSTEIKEDYSWVNTYVQTTKALFAAPEAHLV